jgi:tripartite-type tricarboxylate transporter receptor subunit TctC
MRTGLVSAQSDRTIKIVITFRAGSGGDVLTRAMADEITKKQRPRFSDENAD